MYGEKSRDVLRKLFNVARQRKPSILVLDDLDYLTDTGNKDVDWDRRCLRSELCVQLEGTWTHNGNNAGIIIIGATNNPQNMDEKILQRFDTFLYLPLPRLNARKEMLVSKLLTPNSSLTMEDIAELATKLNGYSLPLL